VVSLQASDAGRPVYESMDSRVERDDLAGQLRGIDRRRSVSTIVRRTLHVVYSQLCSICSSSAAGLARMAVAAKHPTTRPSLGPAKAVSSLDGIPILIHSLRAFAAVEA